MNRRKIVQSSGSDEQIYMLPVFNWHQRPTELSIYEVAVITIELYEKKDFFHALNASFYIMID